MENLVIGGDFVYATDGLGKLNEIQPDSNEVVRHFSPEVFPGGFGLGGFWGTEGSDLLRLDSATFAATELWHVPGAHFDPWDVAFDDESFWLLTDEGFLLQVTLAP